MVKKKKKKRCSQKYCTCTPNQSKPNWPISLGFRMFSKVCLNRTGAFLRGVQWEELISIIQSSFMWDVMKDPDKSRSL